MTASTGAHASSKPSNDEHKTRPHPPTSAKRVREAALDCGVVRQIERAFEDEGLDPSTDETRDWCRPGQRRGTFDRYMAGVDLADLHQVRRVLNVFEEILRWPTDEEYRNNLVRHLRRDGYSVEHDGRIRVGSAHGLAEIPLHHLSEPSSRPRPSWYSPS